MRPLKFRVWDGRVMTYPKTVEIGVNGWNGLTSASYQLDSGGYCTSVYVMQFTGLLDKQGVEIYEGDIKDAGGLGLLVVKFGHYDNGGEYEDHHEGCGWYLQSLMDNGIYGIMSIGLDMNPAIGNIKENPELLKEEK